MEFLNAATDVFGFICFCVFVLRVNWYVGICVKRQRERKAVREAVKMLTSDKYRGMISLGDF